MTKKLFLFSEVVLFGIILFINLYPSVIPDWVLNHQFIDDFYRVPLF